MDIIEQEINQKTGNMFYIPTIYRFCGFGRENSVILVMPFSIVELDYMRISLFDPSLNPDLSRRIKRRFNFGSVETVRKDEFGLYIRIYDKFMKFLRDSK